MDMQKFERTANAIQFATEKLEEQLGTIEGLDNLPRIVQETYAHTKQMQKARPASIIAGSLLGVILGVAIGAFAGYKYASPLELASSTWGLSVQYDQENNAKFYFQKNAWKGETDSDFWILLQKPEVQESSIARKIGEKALKALDETK